MSVARIFTPENRLANILDGLDAPTAGELIADADDRVEALRTVIHTYVADKLGEIMGYAEQGEAILFAECGALSGACLNVAEVAGAAGMGAIGEIARGINAMIDSLTTSGVWHTDALRLHLDALALVNRGPGGFTPENKIILERLRGMRETVGVLE